MIYDSQAISKKSLSNGIVKPSDLKLEISTNPSDVDCVPIVPQKTHYVVEVIYTQQPTQANVNPDWVAGVDIGLNNLAAITSNKLGFVPLLVNGRPLKSINQYYNKKHDQYQGTRIKRGLFRASDGQTINADVNGGYNIIRNVVPNAFADGIEGIAVCPKWLLAA